MADLADLATGHIAPASLDDLFEGKRALIVRHQVVLDNELADRLARATEVESFAKIKLSNRSTDPDAQAEFDQAEAELREAREAALPVIKEVVLQGLGKDAFDRLKRAHGPTESDKTNARKVGLKNEYIAAMEYSPTTFPPVLVAASLIQPKMTEEQAQDLWRSKAWNAAELDQLFLAAMRANQTRAVADLPKAFGATPERALSSPSVTDMEFPVPSS